MSLPTDREGREGPSDTRDKISINMSANTQKMSQWYWAQFQMPRPLLKAYRKNDFSISAADYFSQRNLSHLPSIFSLSAQSADSLSVTKYNWKCLYLIWVSHTWNNEYIWPLSPSSAWCHWVYPLVLWKTPYKATEDMTLSNRLRRTPHKKFMWASP